MLTSGVEDEDVDDPNKRTNVSELDDSHECSFRKRLWRWVTGCPGRLGVMRLRWIYECDAAQMVNKIFLQPVDL